MLVPLFAILGAVVAFGERFDGYEVVGAILIIAGLLVSNFGLQPAAAMKKAEPEGSAN